MRNMLGEAGKGSVSRMGSPVGLWLAAAHGALGQHSPGVPAAACARAPRDNSSKNSCLDIKDRDPWDIQGPLRVPFLSGTCGGDSARVPG